MKNSPNPPPVFEKTFRPRIPRCAPLQQFLRLPPDDF